jgi:hypothetical protein
MAVVVAISANQKRLSRNQGFMIDSGQRLRPNQYANKEISLPPEESAQSLRPIDLGQ